MLTSTEILDIVHCLRTDPEWAKIKAAHCLQDAEACDRRAYEFEAIVTEWPTRAPVLEKTIKGFREMAQRYRERARLYGGEQ